MKIQAVTSGAEVDVSRPASGARKSDAASSPAQATGAEGVVVPSNPNVVVPVQSVEKSKEMERLAEEVQRHFRGDPSKLDISLDKDLKMIVTKVLNADNGEVIRQYPPESVIEVIKYLRAQRGMIVNQKG